jgi:hypothetical protein
MSSPICGSYGGLFKSVRSTRFAELDTRLCTHGMRDSGSRVLYVSTR